MGKEKWLAFTELPGELRFQRAPSFSLLQRPRCEDMVSETDGEKWVLLPPRYFHFHFHFSLNGKWRPHRDSHTVCRIESPVSYSWKMRAGMKWHRWWDSHPLGPA